MEVYKNKNYGKIGFEKAFKKAVPNFDETKLFFSHASRGTEVILQIVWNKKVWKMKLYRSQYYIDLWKNHFIEFFNTGEFDYNGYWKVYDSNKDGTDFFVDNVIHKIPLCKDCGNDFYTHNDKVPDPRINPNHGIKLIPKII